MPPTMTREQKQAKHAQTAEQNKQLGVVEYKSGQKQSDEIWVVTDGIKALPNHEKRQRPHRLAEGNLFHPTESELQNGARALKNKARPLFPSEYAGVRGSRTMSTGADIGIRALEMTNHALKRALDAKLTEADFEGVVPAGADGQYTKAQVEEIIANRRDLAA